jgi:hypothetical protein
MTMLEVEERGRVQTWARRYPAVRDIGSGANWAWIDDIGCRDMKMGRRFVDDETL